MDSGDEPALGSLRRSWDLFRAFRVEQTDPDRFYGLLARDTVRLVAHRVGLAGARVLDVGGGPGHYREPFTAAGARYVAVEIDAREAHGHAPAARGTGVVVGTGEALPVRDGSVDVCVCSNVLEHARDPWRLISELIRVTAPGGTVFLAYTPWWSPWGGHETAPWHYLGGRRARRRYRRHHGSEPKNRFGETLFAVSVGEVLRHVRGLGDITVVEAFPRYHPWWARFVVHLPGVREFAVWNIAIVLRKQAA